MDVAELRHHIYQLTEEEQFYKEQYEARKAGQIHAYIARQDIQKVIQKHLLIPEVAETIPEEFLDTFFLIPQIRTVLSYRNIIGTARQLRIPILFLNLSMYMTDPVRK